MNTITRRLLEIERRDLVHRVTQYDIKQDIKGYSTPYRLGHYFKAINTSIAKFRLWVRKGGKPDSALFVLALEKTFCDLPPVNSYIRKANKKPFSLV